MQAINHLAPEWRDWIRENLARGCPVQSLVDDMVREHFDPGFAQASVRRLAAGEAPQDGATPGDEIGGYAYEAPRLPPGNLIRTSDREVRVALRLQKPVLAVLHGVLDEQECAELIRRSAAQLSRSTTVDPTSGRYEVIAERSSEGTFFPREADPFIARLDRRIAELMGSPVEHGEGLQILHYGVGGEYRPHFDYFPPGDPGSASQVAKGGQRVATLVIYLNAVAAGGATIFPRLGLEVMPQTGSAVYFEYTNSRGQLDPMTLHGGAPVTAGEKWIATKWMRQHRYD